MSRAAVATKKKAAVPAKRNDFLAEALALEGEERKSIGGASVGTFLRLVNGNSNMLKKKHADYWPKVSEGDYVVKERDLILGDSVDVTVLAVLKMYEEVEPKDPKNPTAMAKRIRRVHPEVADDYPVTGRFDRALPNGNVLQPIHYVYMLLNDNPDVGVVILSTAMTANKAITSLGKILKAETTLSQELKVKLTSVQDKEWLVPEFEWDGARNFKVENGTISSVKGGFDKQTIQTVIEKATEIRKQFAAGDIATKDKSLYGAGKVIARAALPAGYTDDEDDEDEDGEEVSF